MSDDKNIHWKKAHDTPYLGSQDLDDYQDVTLTIDEVRYEKSKGLKTDGLFNIAYFKEEGYKPMLLNATNAKVIKRITNSPYINKWGGTRITIYVKQNVEAFGELHDALRIRVIKHKEKPVLDEKSPKWETAKTRVAGGMTIDQLRKHYDVSEENYAKLKENKDE